MTTDKTKGAVAKKAAATRKANKTEKQVKRSTAVAGLTEEERAALNPANRAPAVPTADDPDTDPAVHAATEEELAAVKGAKEVELTTVLVELIPDPMTKLTKRVFEHEIPVLFELHGEDRVNVLEDSERTETVTVSSQQEYDRLSRCYGPKGEEALRKVYTSPRALANEMGLPAPRETGSWRNRQTGSAQRGAGAS